MDRSCDIVIVGTGVAGLFCALNLPSAMQVTIITKRSCEESDSFLAQGGVCVLHDEGDFESFFEDTLCAGHYENDHDAVRTMIAQSREVIGDLVARGVDFNRCPDGSLDYTREAAHSRPRIVFHKDITGFEVSSVLLGAVRALPNVRILEDTTMLDILEEGGRCTGVVACGSGLCETRDSNDACDSSQAHESGRACGAHSVCDRDGEGGFDSAGERDDGKRAAPFAIRANAVVLACGGVGGLFRCSTNFPHIRGEALAIAHKHGVALQNLDYVQIHPTSLYSKKPGRSFLISESVRGEGAFLYDKDGRRFTNELQPRDLLTKVIRQQMESDGTEFVWEDLRPLGRDVILGHFPNIYKRCLEEGYDVLHEPIPVTPAQHYFMGGIKVDLESRTSMTGLYACGEISCNGVHGRNRLASNSLLESLVFSKRAAIDIAASLDGRPEASQASAAGEAIPPDESEGCAAGREVAVSALDLSAYAEPASVLREYADTVLTLMEEDRTRHE